MKVFLQAIVGQLLLTSYIAWRGHQALPAKRGWRIPFLLLLLLEWLFYFTGFFFHKSLPDTLLIAIMKGCNTWYVASMYITLILLSLDLLRLTNRRWHWFPSWVERHYSHLKLTLFVATCLAITTLMFRAYDNVINPTVRHLYLTLPKGDSPRDSLTIAMMSDLHIGEIIGKRQVDKFVELSNAQHPDLVVMVGDIMDYESRYAEQMKAEERLKQLQSSLGNFIVLGNHEYRANRHAKLNWLEKTGATLLIDSVVMPDSSFTLIGRDDYINKQRQPLQSLMREVDRNKPVIVLDHQPWSFAEMRMNGVDLGLHGHTHNGQLWPYPLLMKLIYENPYGYSRRGTTQFYVSSGIGAAGFPYRVGTRSELVVLHITFAD